MHFYNQKTQKNVHAKSPARSDKIINWLWGNRFKEPHVSETLTMHMMIPSCEKELFSWSSVKMQNYKQEVKRLKR